MFYRGILTTALLILLTTTPTLAAKPLPAGCRNPHAMDTTAFTGREGGESVATAVEISLPFMGTGNTSDNVDDHDEVCPYSGGTAPDVVYTFVATMTNDIRVDLCGSAYDTKTYVYGQNLELIGCNDDFYTDPACGQYVSLLDGVPVLEGERYYVVIDGYGSDSGAYLVSIDADCMPPPCIDARCSDTGVAENEPPLIEDYEDVFNSGCLVDPPAFQYLDPAPGTESLEFCGQTGWFRRGGNWVRDEDWLVVTSAGSSVHVETNSTHFLWTRFDVLYLQDCQNISTMEYVMGVCEPGVLDIPSHPGGQVYLRVTPQNEVPDPCAPRQDLYTLRIGGITGSVVATDPVRWDALKSLYR